MQIFPNRTTFLQFGSLTIQWYAVMIVTGAMLGYWLCTRQLKRLNLSRDQSDDFFMYTFLVGIAGARLWYVIFMWNEIYSKEPITSVFKIWEGGLAIQGGIVAGLLFAMWYFKKLGVSFLRAADCCMPNVLIAQAMGRWGNFFNQEAHGTEVTRDFLANTLHLPTFIVEGMNCSGNSYYHPTFLYESSCNVLLWIFIVFVLYKLYKKHGQIFASYFVGYGIIRFFVEGLRTDSLMLGSLRMAQLTSIAFIIFGLALYILLQTKGEDALGEDRLDFVKVPKDWKIKDEAK